MVSSVWLTRMVRLNYYYYYYYYYFISYIAQPTTILIYALYIIETVTSMDVRHIERCYRHIFYSTWYTRSLHA